MNDEGEHMNDNHIESIHTLTSEEALVAISDSDSVHSLVISMVMEIDRLKNQLSEREAETKAFLEYINYEWDHRAEIGSLQEELHEHGIRGILEDWNQPDRNPFFVKKNSEGST